jgi:hypothetical protein
MKIPDLFKVSAMSLAILYGKAREHSTAASSAICDHPTLEVHFDSQAAKGLSAAEVRKRWPRLCRRCPTCGASVVAYASSEHYIAGDW